MMDGDEATICTYEGLLATIAKETKRRMQAEHELALALHEMRHYRAIAYELAMKYEPDYHKLHVLSATE